MGPLYIAIPTNPILLTIDSSFPLSSPALFGFTYFPIVTTITTFLLRSHLHACIHAREGRKLLARVQERTGRQKQRRERWLGGGAGWRGWRGRKLSPMVDYRTTARGALLLHSVRKLSPCRNIEPEHCLALMEEALYLGLVNTLSRYPAMHLTGPFLLRRVNRSYQRGA